MGWLYNEDTTTRCYRFRHVKLLALFPFRHEAEVKGFIPPLDCQDGAARVYHPIVHGLSPDNSPYFAVFLKDFKPHDW